MVKTPVGLVFPWEKLKYDSSEHGSFTVLIMSTKSTSYHKVKSAVGAKMLFCNFHIKSRELI